MLGLVSVSCCGMSQRKSDIAVEEGGVATGESRRASHASMREQKYIRNSSEDPAISSTRSERHVLSNARNHPRAELKAVSNQSSNHIYNHVNTTKSLYDSSINSHDTTTKSCDNKRKRSHEDAEGDVWTEHVSSTGRVYFYNKRLDKSQWERPRGFTKKPKLESTPTMTKIHYLKSSNQSNTSSSNKPSTFNASYTSSSSSKSFHPHSGHSSSHKESIGSSSSHHRDSYHHRERERERESSGSHYRDGGYHRDGSYSSSSSSHQRGSSHYHHEREKGRGDRVHGSHYSSRKHGSHSRSHSRSVSPATTSSTHKGGSRHGRDKSPTRLAKSATTSSRTVTSPLASHSTKPSQATPTPSGGGGGSSNTMVSPTIPASLSHTLSATQQIIDQTSLLIQQQQRIITGEGNSAVTSVLSTPLAPTMHGGTQSPMSQPHARHKLVFTSSSNSPYNSTATQQGAGYIVSGGVVSGGPTTPLSVTSGYITSGGMVSGMGNMSSPQLANLDTTGLHPLQKALLLQNQFSQQAQAQLYQVSDTTGLPLTPVHALPPHLHTPQHSLPGSPLVQSPLQQPQQQMYGVSPLTPIHSNVFTLPSQGGLYEAASATPTNLVTVSSPMSRLGYFEGSRVKEFPDASMLEALGQSQVETELVDRSLTEKWSAYSETMEKQMDGCILESLQRKTLDTIYQSGKLARCRLSVEGSRVKTQSQSKRISNVKSIVELIGKK